MNIVDQNRPSPIVYPTEYDLEDIGLITPMFSAAPISLKPFLVELNIFEDIFGSTISGQLLVSDAVGLFSNYRLNGTEYITINFRKKRGDNTDPIKRIFRLYKISDRHVTLNNQYENYVLNFCSEEFLFSEKYRVSKSYKNKKISDIVSDLLNNVLKISSKNKKKYVEQTQGTYDFVLPNKKLFETINWLSTYALPKSNIGADMLFFENIDGYWFKSLQTLYQQKAFTDLYYDPKNINPDINQKMSNVIDMEIIDSFDILGAISNGTFANKLVTIDPITRTVKTTNFNYDQYFKKSKKLNSSAVTNNHKDRKNKNIFDEAPNDLDSGAIRLTVSNSNQRQNSFIKAKPDAVRNDFDIEKSMMNRAAQLTLANYNRVKVTIPGNVQLSVGMTINLHTPKMKAQTYTKTDSPGDARTDDPHFSGKYLITAVRHIISNMSYITVVEMCKETYAVDMPGAQSSLFKSLSEGLQSSGKG